VLTWSTWGIYDALIQDVALPLSLSLSLPLSLSPSLPLSLSPSLAMFKQYKQPISQVTLQALLAYFAGPNKWAHVLTMRVREGEEEGRMYINLY
jgi:hypothetical protein